MSTTAASTPSDPRDTPAEVRVRFCPSPTGTPHVGLVRTALFNWAYARHTGGKMIFRIEDTDAARDSEESYQQLLDAMRWLGIDWDEGVEVGGPHGPYRQSQRGEIYQDVIAKLIEAGHIYESFSTAEEIAERHRAAGRDPQLGYDGYDRTLTDAQKQAFRDEGREPTWRLRMPDEDLTFTDLVRGEITFKAGSTPDYVVVRANGQPLYTLVNPVDDALMEITHVLRGEDLLSSTPRQVALYRALVDIGVAKQEPLFGHLPYVMGEGNKKLSKRDPESNLFLYREQGFLPEGMVNYLALLGWGYSADQDIFSREQLVERFDVADVNPNPARVDIKKATAINADHIRLLPEAELVERLVPYLQAAGLVSDPITEEQHRLLAAATPLVQTRMNLLGEAPDMLGFLFTADADLVVQEDALKKLGEDPVAVLDRAISEVEALGEVSFTTEALEAALRGAIVEDMGIKPRLAFGPLRSAISGRRISPPLFESMELLGRDSSLARLRALRERLAAS
ncbi:glutamate--tRNA ligase [Brachybacterium phenoliresistens]|uniref:Glutamate--tRNA ligase n=1 Tax=Brachybacterium phenoliresistens TaxID=396014 RepID=Z9JVV3_9MICO|nr:glutamate--tRNA ligase [Brachybacterium phenoliresistens]EWS82500.1 glutamyl-tRNA synthetase [Brachybacterium phenoliresistens]